MGSGGRVTNCSSSTKNSAIGPNVGGVGSARGSMGEGEASIEDGAGEASEEEGGDREWLGL